MNADGSALQLQTQLRVKRKTYLVSAGLLATGLLLHSLLSGTLELGPMLVQLCWSASFILLGVGVGAGLLPSWASGCASGLVCLASATALIHFSGGPESPYFVTLLSVPLLLSMFTPDSRLPTLVSLVAMLAALALLHLLAGNPPHRFLQQMMIFGLIGSIGLYGGRTYRRLREAEKVAQEERMKALEQLAESERLRRHAERERAEVEQLVLVGQLATGVAHEVNNPLAFVKSNLHYLSRELLDESKPPDMEELRELLDETRQGVLRIQQIVADLRRFSREGNSQVEQGSPSEAMEEARRLASIRLHSLGEVTLDIPSELPLVRLEQRRLVQVLLNLLLNAADAVEEARPPRPARIALRARRVERGVRLEVEDNGTGIPPEVLPRIFEPFFTTKPPGRGIGLGLALCREYAARAGGTLIAENRPEGGARFIFTLKEKPGTTSAA